MGLRRLWAGYLRQLERRPIVVKATSSAITFSLTDALVRASSSRCATIAGGGGGSWSCDPAASLLAYHALCSYCLVIPMRRLRPAKCLSRHPGK